MIASEPLVFSILTCSIGYCIDLIIADPLWLPHPVIFFGKSISWIEKYFNRGSFVFIKGAFCSVLLIGCTYWFFYGALAAIHLVSPVISLMVSVVFFYFSLANKGLIDYSSKVFELLDSNEIAAARIQLSKIVGRDPQVLNENQIRIAALETMAENLNDGVIAPLFYYALGGIPAMLAYKMINTLDSMIGHTDTRYYYFGKCAARIDDIANFLPSRITAVCMVLAKPSLRALIFIFKFGRSHASPNSGYPEAALAGILNCRFGGPLQYDGVVVNKPFIGIYDRIVTKNDFETARYVNHFVCASMIVFILIFRKLLYH